MNRREIIRKHISDTLALERHILEAVDRQRDDARVREHPEVNENVIRMQRMLKAHIAELESVASSYDSGVGTLVKKALGGAMGVAAGLYDKMRSQELSRIFRDNYTALSLASMSYVMMHTAALALNEENVARMAKRHLKDIPPLTDAIRNVIPHVVADEIAHGNEFAVVSGAGPIAVENLSEVWQAVETTEA